LIDSPVVILVVAGKKGKEEDAMDVAPSEKKPKKIPKIKGLKLRQQAAAVEKAASGKATATGGGGGGGKKGEVDKSVDEWNAERARLGLKPLK
jgi:hypothetical protein